MSRSQWLRLLSYLAGTLLILLFGIHFLLNPYLEKRVIAMVKSAQKHLPGLKIKEVDVSVLSNTHSIDSFYLEWIDVPADTSGQKLVSHHYYFSSDHLLFEGVNYWKLLWGRGWEIDHLELAKSALEWKISSHRPPAIAPAALSKGMGDLAFELKEIWMDSLRLSVLDSMSNITHRGEMRGVSATVSSRYHPQSDTAFVLERFQVKVANAQTILYDNLYDLSFRNFHVHSGDSTLQVDSLLVIPLYDKIEYAHRIGYKTDRIKLISDRVELEGWNVQRFINDNYLQCRNFLVHDSQLDIFRDARLEFPPDKRSYLLQSLILRSPVIFDIDSLVLSKAAVRYEEKKLEEQSPGELVFSEIVIHGGRITNDTALMDDIRFHAKGTGKLMGEGEMKVDFMFPLDRWDGYHEVSGELGPFKIEEINPILYPLTNLRISSGQSEHIYFNMYVDDQAALGDLRFYYEDLSITYRPKKRKWWADLSSFVANEFIQDSNPLDGEFRQGTIHWEREPERSMINYWWRGLRTGLISSTGLSPDLVRKLDE